ncbi:ubiquitin carboxyl-terminal hydrolase 14 isoform X2 [Daucus carota subsp. sativus]|uniref:Peptidase C19 ubiquitin carboxyl-terminal hydrolase domain-containing protein n=1 Tax=Daucus carota subsp. sativus TaxID=79200 RepID=A0A175YQN4_DAUCS|nr:PREDICTED: ubiquitin carboxyl-terminal hydrolase 14-like isoform X2 [Daucus carota subsp. sativus]
MQKDGNADSAANSTKQEGIPPRMFKAVIASSHPEFSTMRQQDAFEFFLHFIDQVEVLNAGNPQLDPSRCFKFGIEERLQCPSGKVAYNSRQDCILSLNIPLDRAINRSRVQTNWTGEPHWYFYPLCPLCCSHLQRRKVGEVIYNDAKVGASKDPPKDMGYLYFYERIVS